MVLYKILPKKVRCYIHFTKYSSNINYDRYARIRKMYKKLCLKKQFLAKSRKKWLRKLREYYVSYNYELLTTD